MLLLGKHNTASTKTHDWFLNASEIKVNEGYTWGVNIMGRDERTNEKK